MFVRSSVRPSITFLCNVFELNWWCGLRWADEWELGWGDVVGVSLGWGGVPNIAERGLCEYIYIFYNYSCYSFRYINLIITPFFQTTVMIFVWWRVRKYGFGQLESVQWVPNLLHISDPSIIKTNNFISLTIFRDV